MDDGKIMGKVKKLLALSSSPNEGEAETALKFAYELLARHNLSMADIPKESAEYVELKKDTGQKRMSYKMRLAANILIGYFNVKILYGRRSGPNIKNSFLGSKSNVEIAEYMYAYLIRIFEEEWKRSSVKPRAHKNSFFKGMSLGICKQLDALKKEIEEETALVIADDPHLSDYINQLYPKRGISKAPRMAVDIYAQSQGLEAGEKVQLKDGLPSNKGEYLC